MIEESNSVSVSAAATAIAVESVAARKTVAETCTNVGLIRLQRGDYTNGWRYYEWRRHFLASSFLQGVPVWYGQNLVGKSIYLFGEQGYGDTLHFMRYASVVAELGARPILGVPRPLKRLAQTVPGVLDAFYQVPPNQQIAWQGPMMSVPFILGTDLSNIPSKVPYVTPDPIAVSAWRGFIPPPPTLNVGIAWGGNPKHGRDKHRSISLSLLSPLGAIEGIALFSMQKGKPAEQLQNPPPNLKIMEMAVLCNDFADTAAAMAALDLVITVDTSICHLAGALGIPVWIMLDAKPDFRWLSDRTDSPWYPSARLFRQKTKGDWAPVVEEVACALESLRRSN
jgi:hypothetical protein